MAIGEPSEDLIQSFAAVSGLGRDNIILRLKGNDNNLESAANEFFEDPTSTKYMNPKLTWDENLHEADRHGELPAFHIHGPDEVPAGRNSYHQFDGGLSGGPSRAPSPHPSFGPHLPDDHSSMPALIEENGQYGVGDDDRDMARAIEASLQEQDSGVIAFGPATRPEGYGDNWGMVLSSSSSQASDPEPPFRKRDLGNPAFLKPGKGNHRIAALFTIYHEIPMLRELMLDRLNVMPNYGSNPEWWNGNKPVELPSVIEESEDEFFDNAPTKAYTRAPREFKAEIQRLMAFLDKTDRSYGSVEALVKSQAVRDHININGSRRGTEESLIEVYGQILCDNPEKHKRLFSRVLEPQRTGANIEGEDTQQGFALFDLAFPEEDSTDETIYDLADGAMWPDENTDISTTPYLSHIADVVTFRLTNWNIHKKTGVEFPVVWYPDRYLKSARQEALNMRVKKLAFHKKLENIKALEIKLTEFQGPTGASLKVQDVLKAALQHDVAQIKPDEDSEDELMELSEPSKTQNLSAQLVKLAESIDRKVKALNEEKERCKDELRQLSKLYTTPSEDSGQPALHRYTLRGVCMDKSTMFICRQGERNLIDIDLGDEESTGNPEQWWRINYAASDSNPVSIEKTTEERALEAARFHTESGGPIVIYASDKAMQWESQPLPAPLETFVRKDNAFFKSELSSVASPKTPVSPSKRKYDDRFDSSELESGWSNSPQLVSMAESNLEANWNGTTNGAPIDPSLPALPRYEQSAEDVIMGVEPTIEAGYSSGQEMQERSGMRLLRASKDEPSTIDNMDLDSMVVEDELQAVESSAVRHAR